MNKTKKTADSITAALILLTPIFFWVSCFIILCVLTSPAETRTSLNEKLKYFMYGCIGIELISISVNLILGLTVKKSDRPQLKMHRAARAALRHKLLMLPVIAVFLILMFITVICSVQDKLVFMASRNKSAEKTLLKNADFEAVHISGKKGMNYTGYIHRCGNDSATMILFFGGNAQTSAGAMAYWDSMDAWQYIPAYDLMIIDYPGYGTSDGTPSEQGFYDMADSVMKQLSRQGYRPENITVMAFSIGTGVANYVGANYDVSKLILAAPYERALDFYNSYLNIFHGPLEHLANCFFESYRRAEDISEPVVIIASVDDEIIPIDSTRRLNEHYGDSQLHELSGCYHNDIFSQQETWEIIEETLK